MSSFSPLLIISYDPEERLNLSSLASGLGYPDAEIVVGGVGEAVAALNVRTISPDYLIIDIADKHTNIFDDLDEIALHCEPKVQVVVIGSVNDINFYRQLRARGIAEYCARPAKIGDIRSVLLQSSSTNNAKNPSVSKRGTVISCISAASGDGASTFAVNLAYCLAEEFEQSTVLIDMDYQFGLIAKSLDITAPFGIRELFDFPERGIDELLIEKMLAKHGKNLSIIASPHELRQLPAVKPELVRDMISLLRTKFNFVILDIPHIWTGWTAASLTYSDHVIMVAQLWLRSLTHSSRLLAVWQTIGLSEDSISVVINRSGAKFKEAITAHDFERITHHKIESYLSNDIKSVVLAESEGKTLFEIGHTVLLQQQIRQFTKNILARSNIEKESPNTNFNYSGTNVSNRKNLLTFLGKKNG
ncbi:MAG: AAA family ATPase [Pseudomonadota bacterium]